MFSISPKKGLVDECSRKDKSGTNEEFRFFIRLWRRWEVDPGTAASQSLLNVERKLRRLRLNTPEIEAALYQAVEPLARRDLETGAPAVARVLALLAPARFGPHFERILEESIQALQEWGAERPEYLVLGLHTLNAALNAYRLLGDKLRGQPPPD